MRVYTVQERPTAAGADPDVVLVKEGFNWPAFLVPLVWLILRAQWLGLLAYVAVTLVLGMAAESIGLPRVAEAGLGLLLSLLVGAEANDWRRWRLAARGYEIRGVVAGRNLAEAEERWIRGLAETAPPSAAAEGNAPRHPPPAWHGSGLSPFPTPVDRA